MKKTAFVFMATIMSLTASANSFFTVKQYNVKHEINSLAEAESLLSNTSQWKGSPITRSYNQIAFIHYLGADRTPHFKSQMVAFPDISAGSMATNAYFVLEVTGVIFVPEAGTWTFACGSDDGMKITLSGRGLSNTYSGNGGAFSTYLAQVDFPCIGTYNFRLLYYNRCAEAALELSVAKGSHPSFSSAFKLVGTEASGIMLADDFVAPSNLQATDYHNQHPQGVKLTWSPVANAPGYVILRKIVGENEFYPVGATPDTEYINKVATIPNVKDLKAQYTVAVADWQGNDPNTIVYLSPRSNLAWGSWIDKGYPRIVKVDQLLDAYPSEVFLTGCTESTKEPNTFAVTFGSYDTTRFRLQEVHVSASHDGTTLPDFVNDWNHVSFRLPEGKHGKWTFVVKAVFLDKTMNAEYITTPVIRSDVRVCFLRTGRDGIPVQGASTGPVVQGTGSQDILIPNWFKYWMRDGALTSFNVGNIYYAPRYRNALGGTYPNGTIELYDKVITDGRGMTIDLHSGATIKLHSSGLTGKLSIYNCAETLKHELGHREFFMKRGFRARNDRKWLQQGKDRDKDGISNDDESSCLMPPLDPDKADSIGFYNAFYGKDADKDKRGRSYAIEDCDEEVYVRYHATIANNEKYFNGENGVPGVVIPQNDWSWDYNDVRTSYSGIKSATLLQSKGAADSTDDPVLDSGCLYDINRFGGSPDAEYEDENLIIIGVDSVAAVSAGNEPPYETLSVSLRCAALEKGYATIVVSLVDESNNAVAWASRTGDIESGTNTYEVSIAGDILHDSRRNGFTVSRVTVLRGDGSTSLPLAMLQTNVSSPVIYKWSDFRTDNVTIQSLALSEGDGCVNVSAEIVVPSEDGVYDLSTFLCDAGTSDYVAEASQTNVVLHAGTNAVSLAFANSDIQMNAVSNAFAISKFTVEKDGEIVAAYNGDATLNVVDETILNPTNAVLAFDEATVTNELVAAEGGALYSGVNFAFDVVNSYTNAVDYTLTAYLNSTNSLTVDMATFDLSLTSGVNRITIPFLGAKIRESGIDGPYVLSSVRLESKDEAIASQTLRMDSRTEDCTASNFQGDIITRLVGISRKSNRDDSIVASITFETAGAVSGIVNASLVDADNKVIMFGSTGFAADCAGTKNVEICFAVSNITESAYSMPLRIAYISIEPSDKLLPSLADDTLELAITELDYLEPAAAPMFSPATKTVFFRREQTVSISCATPAAAIRYTLDGSEPTASSKIYDGSFVITNSVTVKAKAFVEGLSPSETVQAEYVRASIVGDNLVQETAPAHGVAQSVSVPVPGTYRVSFGWTQGGSVELRLSKGGDVRTIAAISAENAGTTNLLFDISTAGDYELTVYDPSSGTVQPAQVSNLSMSIPDTPENKGRYWIYETEDTYGSTGEWSGTAGFTNGKIPVIDKNTFTPYTPSNGDLVEIISTIEFGYLDFRDAIPDCKCALSIGKDELGTNAFRVPTMEHGVRIWKNVYGEGLAAPTLGTPYTVKFTLDYTNRTYTIAIVTNQTEIPLTDGTTGTFALADSHDSSVKNVEFTGDSGNVISLFGNYKDSASEFAENDTLYLSGGAATLILTARQAAWLNSMNAYDAIKTKTGRMGMEDFMVAYLLNLDLTKDGAGLVSFRVSEIEVGETDVVIKVRLDRTGTMQTSADGESRDASINGILKLYGGDSPTERVLLNATKVTDANFGEGDTATFTYPRSGRARFFRPVIEVPSN